MAGEIRIVKGNMHRSKVANNILRPMQAEHEADLLFMCEQYENPSIKSWLPDKTGTAAIWITNPGAVPAEEKGLGDGYV